MSRQSYTRGRGGQRRLIDASFESNADQLNCGRRPRVPACYYLTMMTQKHNRPCEVKTNNNHKLPNVSTLATTSISVEAGEPEY